MKHVENICSLIRTLIQSDTFHCLIVESLPGIGKSSSIHAALSNCGVSAVSLESYSTPLHLFQTICKNPNSILLLDDVGSILGDPKAMAILKAATWESDGREARRVSWGSSSEKVSQPAANFFGKIIILTNAIPSGKETDAFLSRCLTYRIRLDEGDIRALLSNAAKNPKFFPDSAIAEKVVIFLVRKSDEVDMTKINLRTLRLGYEFAKTLGDRWQDLFLYVLPHRTSTKPTQRKLFAGDEELHARVLDLFQSPLPNCEKETRFISLTGKSRRTFYNYRKRLGGIQKSGGKGRNQALESTVDSKNTESATVVDRFESGGKMSILNKLKAVASPGDSNGAVANAISKIGETVSPSLGKVLTQGKDYVEDDSKYLTYVAGPLFKMLPLPVQLLGKERLKWDPIMLDVKKEALVIESGSITIRPDASSIFASIVKRHHQN